MRRPRVLCVIDDPGWIQARRLNELRRRLPDLRLEPCTPDAFARGRRLGRFRRTPVYFGTWRLLPMLEAHRGLKLTPALLGRTMVSVTSHYNLGGGLDPAKALRAGTDPGDAFLRAVELLRACAVVTVNSSPLRDLLSPHVPGLVYAPNGVDHEFFHPPPARSYDPARIRVGWVGKVKAAKNVETVEAAAALAGDGFAFELLGQGKDDGAALDAAGMRDYYRRLDWYLCASWHEGTPNPALEAAACGVPLVTTRVGNMVDLVRHGENGFFVEPTVESVVELLRTLRGLPASEHERLSRNARASVEAEWTWERNIAPYREAFEILLGSPHPRAASLRP